MPERRTRQLTAVLEVVGAACDHPTAAEVFRRVRGRLPRVSLATVYRNLEKLAADDRIRVVRTASSAARFDGMLERHDHFVCEGCNAVQDVPPRAAPADFSRLAKAGYAVTAHALTIYGVCPGCAPSRGSRLVEPRATAGLLARPRGRRLPGPEVG